MSDTELDPFDPSFIACPFPRYEALRDGSGATWVPHGKGFWLITRHDLVRRVAGDVGTFSSEAGSLGTVPGCRSASSETMRGEADPMWCTWSSALGSRAMKSAEITRRSCHCVAASTASMLSCTEPSTRVPSISTVGVPVTLSFDIWSVAFLIHCA